MTQYALLVGVGSFENGLGTIAFAEDDVNGVYQVLLDTFYLPYENIEYLTNENATHERILSAVHSICAKANEGDRVILYFATHGKTAYNTTFLSAYDACNEKNEDISGWVRIETLLGLLHQAKCNVLAFLDCCHSTQFFFGRSIHDNLEQFTTSSCSAGEYTAVFAAAGENEKAYPVPALQHGCWTYYLLKALSGNDLRAFRGVSRRITINSLQSYLKEKVTARVLSEYQQKQTPYIWGTYSDDEVIVELPETEEMVLKVKDIYFGEIDADSEKTSAPDTNFIARNFYDLNSICSILSSNNNLQVIIGNKGSGKTYLGEYLESSSERMVYQSIGTIPFSYIHNITFAQSDARGKYVVSWAYALYTILSCIIVQQNKPGAAEFRDLLTDIYGQQIEIILQSFTAGKRMLLNKKLKQGVKLRDQYSFFEDEKGITNIDGLNLIYASLFDKYYSSEPLYFFLDGLDEQLRGKLTDEQKNYLLDLLSAVEQSRHDLKNTRIILLFRNDLLHALSGEANINKTITARSCNLSWLSTDTNYPNTPLYRFIEKRIATSAETAGIHRNITLSDILPPTIDKSNTWEWILRLTTYTPRDIVSFFNCCKQFVGEEQRITEDNLWDATRPYSEYLWMEFQDVLAGTSLAGREEEILRLFDELSTKYNLQANTRFDYVKFNTVYQETSGLEDIPISDALKILYEAGIMCVHTKIGTYSFFRENPLRYDHNIWKESKFELHVGLWKKFHIW